LSETPWYEGIEARVVDAYKRRGLKSAAFDFKLEVGTECCCAFGVLYNERYPSASLACRGESIPLDEGFSFIAAFDLAIRFPKVEQPPQAIRAAGWRTAQAVIAACLRV